MTYLLRDERRTDDSNSKRQKQVPFGDVKQKGNAGAMTTTTAMAQQKQGKRKAGEEDYIPTHRDTTAMDGPPDPLWLFRMTKTETTTDRLIGDDKQKSDGKANRQQRNTGILHFVQDDDS
jgi:hypothetical protein